MRKVALPPSALVAMMDAFGRHEFGDGQVGFGLDPRSAGCAGGDIWSSIVAPLAVLAQPDPSGFLMALRDAVLPVGGWPVYGAARLLPELFDSEFAHPALDELCDAAQAPTRWHHAELAARPQPPDDTPQWIPSQGHEDSDDTIDLPELAELAAMVTEPPEGTDLAEITGLLGVALMGWYDRDGDLGTVSAGIDHLQDALALDPSHADRAMWLMLLSAGYGERARLADRLEDHDAAVSWTAAALAELAPDDPDFDALNVALAEYTFDRFFSHRSAHEWDEPTARAEVEHLVGRLEPLAAGDPQAASYLRMLLGMGYLERFGVTEAAADLDRAIPLLEEGLAELPPDTVRRPAAGPQLVDAYRHKFEVTGDRENVDRAIAVAADLIRAGNPSQPEWGLLHRSQAEAYERRWHSAAEDPADLDRAVDCWQVVWDVQAAADASLSRSVLLYERAHLTTPPAESDLAEAALGVEHALRQGNLPPAVLLYVHWNRLLIMIARTGQPAGAPDADERRRLVEEAHTALAEATTAPPDERAFLAGVLSLGEFSVAHAELARFDRSHGGFTLDGFEQRVRGLLTLAAQLPDPPLEWQAMLDFCRGTFELLTGGSPGEARERFAQAADVFGPRLPQVADRASHIAMMLSGICSTESGDQRGRQAAAGQLSQPEATAEEQDVERLLLGQIMSALYRGQFGDLSALREAAPKIASLRQQQPASQSHDLVVAPLAQLVLAFAGTGDPPPAAVSPPASSLGALLSAPVAGGRVTASLGRMASAVTGADLAGLRRCAAELDALASEPMPAGWVRFLATVGAGLAYLQVARWDRSSRSAAERAVRWWEEAVTLAGGSQHPLWSTVAGNLAESLRLAASPDRARARKLGISALKGHAWQVLRQTGTDYALDTVRDSAAADVYTVARWCLEDDATEDLVATLDLGRGRLLNAATTSRGVADRLTELGHHDLAAEWRATAGLGRDRFTGAPLPASGDRQIPDDLRLRALEVLRREAPIRIGEIQEGLSRLGADALAYLVPDRRGPALAVVVPASGPVETVPLPDLTTDPASPLSRYTGPAGAARDVDPVEPGAGSLEELCDWAWRAAMGPLVDHMRRWQLRRRPARLVLVPMGRLGLVPWHAAYTSQDPGRRYAIEDLVISYSPSARTLCRAARQPDRPIQSALVVGNPGGDLVGAGIEARAIHRRFYPDGTYLGQPAVDGAGTPEEVLAWIDNAAPGPSLLHFACHGRVDAGKPADAHLVLASGRRLAARDLLDASRLAALEMDTVYLAACNTQVAGEDFDEVLSLATAFLAAGARTVFGSLWRVPDEATSLLMYLVHHHVTVEGAAPAEALHRAQLWMLDPDRQPPAGMPNDLARLCSRPAAADLVSWAAFTHLGR